MDRDTSAMLERASALRRTGRVDEAIAAYEAVLERDPQLPNSWYNLAWLQRQARQYQEALSSYAEALERGVDDPHEVHLNRAVILSDHLARPADAEAELQAALKLKPGYLAALLNLGNLREDMGDRPRAEQAYRQALTIAPGDALALSRLAGVVDANSVEATSIVAGLGSALSTTSEAAERADLGFALGRLLDARGDYAGAFSAYEAANDASRESFGPAFAGYDRATHEAFVDRMIATFAEPAPETSEASPSIFIVGMFRSGSTLVEQILASHGSVAAGGELDLIPALVQRIDNYPEAVARADAETVKRWRDFYVGGVPDCDFDTCVLTDKRPDNFLHIGLIKTMFPGAKIIHTRRNKLDNLLSLYFLHLGPAMPYALDLVDAAHWHREYERLMAHWKQLYPDDIFDVDYDTLVREPKPVAEGLLGFLGLDWDDSVLDFHRRKGAVKTASVWQVREPLHGRSSGRWRNYELQLNRLRIGSG
jgi:tetratricopeptide (TPR) repeat protein